VSIKVTGRLRKAVEFKTPVTSGTALAKSSVIWDIILCSNIRLASTQFFKLTCEI
jgi:hypothetical protein